MTRQLALLFTLLTTTACVIGSKGPSYPKAEYSPATVVGNRVEIADAKSHYAPLIIEAKWTHDGHRYCVSNEDIALITPSGPMTLRRAKACMTTQPFSLVGEAEVPFPGLGYLGDAGVTGNAPRAKIAMGLGSQIPEIEVSGERLAVNPNQFYLTVDYYSGLSAQIGKVALTSPAVGAKMVVAPQEPMIYVAGSLAGIIDDVGLGFSATGRLPFSPRRPLYDGSGWSKQRFTGHVLVHGTFPIPKMPVSVSGRVLIDADANDDGRTIFEGTQNDMSLAADGTVSFGYNKAGFGFSVELADASVAYDGHKRLVSFVAHKGGGLFKGTPLEFIDAGSKTVVRGFFRSPEDFEIVAEVRRGALGGFAMADMLVTLSSRGIQVRGDVDVAGMGKATVVGSIGPRGQFNLEGRAAITVGGFRMADARVGLGTSGIKISGTVALPGVGNAKVSGTVGTNGRFKLSGRATLRPAGIKLANAKVTLSNTRAAISGHISFLGNRIGVSGTISARGDFRFKGSVHLNALLVKGTLEVEVGNRGIRGLISGHVWVVAWVPIAGIEVDTRGRICPILPTGKVCIKV